MPPSHCSEPTGPLTAGPFYVCRCLRGLQRLPPVRLGRIEPPGRDEFTTQVYLPDELVTAILDTAEHAAQVRNEHGDLYAADTLLGATGDAALGLAASIQLVLG